MLSNSQYRKLVFLGLCALLFGAEGALASREIAVQSAVTAIAEKPNEDGDSARASNFTCLPKDVRGDEIVSYEAKKKSSVTVEKKLIEMKARCRGGKLLDAKGREIRFFRVSCWGNPPEDYLEIQKRESAELAELKRHYTVIVFGCNPTTP